MRSSVSQPVTTRARNAQPLMLVVVLFAATLMGCAGTDPVGPSAATLRVSGSSSMKPLLNDLAQAYQRAHPNVSFEIHAGGSAAGVSELQNAETDLAAVSWKAETDEMPAGFQAVPIARDALALIVHPSNPVPALTILQLRRIYRGEILDWAALGGRTGEPIVISREDGSGDRASFEALVMGGDQATPSALVMPGAQAAVDYVAGHRDAIAYVSMALLNDQVKAVPVEDVAPAPASVRSGAYHLGRLLYLYTPKPAPPLTRSFIDFVLSPAGQAVVAKHHVPLR
jgi:phosphate transport system substrate-binding protein